MIFVTVGTQGRFDRLIRAVDEWAGVRAKTDVFAQTGTSDYRPKHICAEPFISPTDFRKCMESATFVIAHAGIGSIISALELGKQIIVMPRRAHLGEHRNDHQVATATRLAAQGRILAVADEQEMFEKLDNLEMFNKTELLSRQASADLIGTIRMFIETGRIPLTDNDASAG